MYNLDAVTWDYFTMVTDSGKLKLISLTIRGELLIFTDITVYIVKK